MLSPKNNRPKRGLNKIMKCLPVWVLLQASPSLANNLLAAEGVMKWHSCGMRLAKKSGVGGDSALRLVTQIAMSSTNVEPEFLQLLFSVIYVESGFRRAATSSAGAVGLMQITRPAAEHAALNCSLKLPLSEESHSVPINVSLGSCYLKLALDSAGGDMIGALAMYNGGYSALTALNIGDSLPNETAQYIVKVLQAFNSCDRMESTK